MKDGVAAAALWAPHASGRFALRHLPGRAAGMPPYAVWVPAGAEKQHGLPVILALHGSGECGFDGQLPTRVGLGPVLPDDKLPCPALVVFPQAAPEEDWCGPAAQRALAALDAVIAEFHADATHAALTGMSLGGAGVWFLAATQPRRFRRLAAVCGWLDVGRLPPALRDAGDPHCEVARRLRGTSVCLFHGTEDDVVPPEGSRRMARALAAEGVEVQYTEYAGVGHGAWVPAYREPGLVGWLAGALPA